MYLQGRVAVCKRKSHKKAGDDLRTMFSRDIGTPRSERPFDGKRDTEGVVELALLCHVERPKGVETSTLHPECLHYLLCPGQRTPEQGLFTCKCDSLRAKLSHQRNHHTGKEPRFAHMKTRRSVISNRWPSFTIKYLFQTAKRGRYTLYSYFRAVFLNISAEHTRNLDSSLIISARAVASQVRNSVGQSSSNDSTLGKTLRAWHCQRTFAVNKGIFPINCLHHFVSRPLARSRGFFSRQGGICIWRSIFKAINAGLLAGLAHTERDKTTICKSLNASRGLFAAPLIKRHHPVNILLRVSHSDKFYDIRTMITALFDHAAQLLDRCCAGKIMIGTDKHCTVLMSRITHSFGHLLLRFHLHIHITRSSLYGTHQSSFCSLHRPDFPALLRQILQRRVIGHYLRDPTCRHQRDIRREHLIDILHGKVATVKADFRHLATFQRRQNTLQILIYYRSTDHNRFIL